MSRGTVHIPAATIIADGTQDSGIFLESCRMGYLSSVIGSETSSETRRLVELLSKEKT